jgi:hypothetical protein
MLAWTLSNEAVFLNRRGAMRARIGFLILGLSLAWAGAARSDERRDLKALRENPSADERARAADALRASVRRGDDVAIVALGATCREDPAVKVRLAAVKALGDEGRCETVRAPLLVALGDVELAVRRAADDHLKRLACAVPAVAHVSKARPSAEGVAARVQAGVPGAKSETALNRMLWGPTAHAVRAGESSWSFLNILGWIFSYGIRDDLELSVLTAPPVGGFVAIPSLRYHFGNDTARFALVAQGGGLIPYIENVPGLWLAGGGAVGSFGGKETFFNVSFFGYGAGVAEKSSVRVYDSTSGIDTSTSRRRLKSTGFLLGSMGGNFKVSKALRIILEGYLPILVADRKPIQSAGILYGVRIRGERMYGDISFLIPIFDGAEDLLKVIPLGLPLLSFGVTW